MSATRKPRRASQVKTRVESKGVRTRLGVPVMDAAEPLYLPLTKRDITAAKNKRGRYDVNDPQNFGECVLATCVSKVSGARCLVMRQHAYILLPDADHALRYEVAPESVEIIHLNDESRFDEIPTNVTIKLRPPCKSRRLVSQRAQAKAYREGQGPRRASDRATARKQRNVEGLVGVWRHGTHATDEA